MRKETFRGDLIENGQRTRSPNYKDTNSPYLNTSSKGKAFKSAGPSLSPKFNNSNCSCTKTIRLSFDNLRYHKESSSTASNCDQGSHTVTYGTGKKVYLISQSDDYCLSSREKRVEGTNADVTWRDVVIHRANRAGPTRQLRIVDPQTLEEERINNYLPQKQNNRPARPEPVPVQVGNNLNGAIERQLQDLEKLKSSKSELEVALTRKQMEVKVYEEELRRIVMKEKEMDCALEAVFSG
ncbi:hypothetical protein M422DRAFT_275706 [Sphaerobolus stellatus SS14]|uniref:Uncharacterized protein n=1 Tax=Sphaerobolus stellatus (strain SS14) TaxID=990650 RepID=A0A0C9UDX0_SPHS4|nr:hypothetical protein M422DRAFT_275706 [Sphaerobolus stellatus SS14]